MRSARFRSFLPAAAAAVAAIALPAVPASAIERISVADGGAQANSQSRHPAISWDGRYIAFDSDATNLVPGDSNGQTDIFVRDRLLGTTTRISTQANGSQSVGASGYASISADGMRVVFNSFGPLLPDSGYYNCYLLDRSLGTLDIVDRRSDNGQAGSAVCEKPSIDLFGAKVAFATRTAVVPGDTNDTGDVFVRDYEAGTTRRVSVGPGGVQGNSDSYEPRISGDGSIVAFGSPSSNLVAGDSNGGMDVFAVRTDGGGVVTRISVGPGNTQASGPSSSNTVDADSALNFDGSLYAFSSDAMSLPDWDELAERTLYLRYPAGDATIAISLPVDPGLGRDGFNGEPDFSATGQYLVFVSTDDLLLDGEVTGGIYVVDLVNGWITRVSVGGNTGNVHQPRISGDGSGVTWDSFSDTQVAGDTNGTWDVFYAENPLYDFLFFDGFDGR